MTAETRVSRWETVDPWDLDVPDRVHHPVKAVVRWLACRHRLTVEIALVVVLYVVYDTSRGLVSTSLGTAVAHADLINNVEHFLHINVEHTVQRLAGEVPGLLWAFALGYTTLHLLVTGATLLWLYRTNALAYVRLRLALLATSLLALLGFIIWPTAPPRLAGIGLADSVNQIGINMDSHTLTMLYNPYAAFPSLHEAYAVLAGFALWRWSRNRPLRALGVLYPAWVGVEVIATGNHFVLDVVTGACVAVTSLLLARRMAPGKGRTAAADSDLLFAA